jgi:very-short-patch-repair endonuclease
LQEAGYHIIRFHNHDVLGDISAVKERIREVAESLPQRAPGYISRTDGW